MKKLVMALAIMAIAAIAQEQAFRFPGWKCKDAALIEQQLALAPYEGMKVVLTYMLDFATNGAPATFAEMRTRIDTAIDTVNPDFPADRRPHQIKQCALCTGQFYPELVAYCQANPCAYNFHVGLKDKTEWGWEVVGDCLLKYHYSPSNALRAINYLNTQAIALGKPNPEVFKLLSDLNKKYTGLLIKDKEKWGDVVAHVRTLMEVYK